MSDQERGIYYRVRTVHTKNERKRSPALRNLKKKTIMEEEKRAYCILSIIPTDDITATSDLV